MALMYPRIAPNYAKNGYFPIDETTLERSLNALTPSAGCISILDPCAGEGVAIAEAANALGREQVRAFAIEYNAERASGARKLVDRCLHSDLLDTVISRQSFGLLWLNPPYGDLVKDQAARYQGHGRARLEKLFYQFTLPTLQYDGILILTIPAYSLDAEFVSWLTNHFIDLRIYAASDTQFKQVVLFGRRVRQRDQTPHSSSAARKMLVEIGHGDSEPKMLPAEWPFPPYSVPSSAHEPEHFYRLTLEPQQFAAEIQQLQGLWPSLEAILGGAQQSARPPARPLSQWHLALALAAGAISGVVTSKNGRVFVVKGDTHKEKSLSTEYTTNDDGSATETRVLTDRFIPVIRAWDMTPGSATPGQVLTIR